MSALLLAGLLAACGRTGTDASPSAAPAPAAGIDARLAAVYERACMSCHEVPGSGAPQRGDRAAWSARQSTGRPALVASVRQGKGAMPPMGWCPECSDADFAALIDHLAGRAP